MELVEFVGICCIVVTLFMFATGIPPCVKMVRTGSVRDVPFLLFLLSVISCSGMVHYGLLIDDKILIFLNTVGAGLNFIYMAVYIIVIRSKSGPLSGVLVGLLYMAGLYWYCFNVIGEPEEYAQTIATASSSITTFLILLGSIEVVMNYRNKNSDGMAFIMWTGSLVCGIAWLAYGLLVNDFTIWAPNIPGLSIALAKMYMFASFPNSAESVKSTIKID